MDALAHSWPRGLCKYAFPPLRPASQSWCSSWQPLLGRFLWGRTYWLRDRATCGTHVQISGNFMPVPWMGREGSRGHTRRGSRHHHFGESAVYETCLRLEVERDEKREEKTPGSARSASCSPFFQEGLEQRLSPSTLKVYVAAIAPNHDPVEGKSLEKHDWVIRFLKGPRRLNPSCPPPFFTLLVSVSSAHSTTAGPVWAFADSRAEVPKKNSTPACTGLHHEGWGPTHISVNDLCLEFGPADSQIILRPWPGYVPKVLTTPFRARWWACKRFPRRRQTQP